MRAARRVWWERVQITYREWWEETETKEHCFTPFTTAFLIIYTKMSPQNWSWATRDKAEAEVKRGRKRKPDMNWSSAPGKSCHQPCYRGKTKREGIKQKNRQELEERLPEKNYSRLSCPLSASLFPSALAFFAPAHRLHIMPASSKFGQWRIMKN